ncbi:hypothetical protein [Streptomyces sp. NPDC093223]|uniref:hypothetical protein n=1 Tax=Streptomyces sp. NPDC093223 TaxID=3366033 RepID=UPI00382FF67D
MASDDWAGGWFRIGDGDWALYRRVADDGRGVVLAEVQDTGQPGPAGAASTGERVPNRNVSPNAQERVPGRAGQSSSGPATSSARHAPHMP